MLKNPRFLTRAAATLLLPVAFIVLLPLLAVVAMLAYLGGLWHVLTGGRNKTAAPANVEPLAGPHFPDVVATRVRQDV